MARTQRKTLPAKNPEARLNQLINDAMNLAEQKLRDGTASSQIITTLLQMGTVKAKLELKKLESDLKVADARVKQMENEENSSVLYAEALKAFASYQGTPMEDEYDDEDDY